MSQYTEPVESECSDCGASAECEVCNTCDEHVCTSEHSDGCYYCERCDETYRVDGDNPRCTCGCRSCRTYTRCTECCGHDTCSNCERCTYNDCDCLQCDDCAIRTADTCACAHHTRCIDCCNCSFCDECRSNSCECECDESDRNSGIYRKYPLHFYTSRREQFKRNPLRRHLSAEIEVAGVSRGVSHIDRAADKWRSSIVEDGSLPDSGFEINTAPANGDQFVNEITELCTALAQDGARVTTECGLHVHVDARDLRPLQVRALVEIYCALEELLFAALSNSRQHSHYTERCAEAYRNDILSSGAYKNKDIKRVTITSVYGDRALQGKASYYKEWKTEHRAGNRYYALNLHSYFLRGTVEFRHHHGTVNAEKIIQWARLCGYLVEAANRLPLRRVQHIVNSLFTYRDEVVADPHVRARMMSIESDLRYYRNALDTAGQVSAAMRGAYEHGMIEGLQREYAALEKVQSRRMMTATPVADYRARALQTLTELGVPDDVVKWLQLRIQEFGR